MIPLVHIVSHSRATAYLGTLFCVADIIEAVTAADDQVGCTQAVIGEPNSVEEQIKRGSPADIVADGAWS